MKKTKQKLKSKDALNRFNHNNVSFLAHAEVAAARQPIRYGFVMGNLGFLIAENTLSEVIINTKIYPIPNTQIGLQGLINVRGNLVPVFDFSLLLGMTKPATEQKKLLVIGEDSHSLGLLVDGLPKACDMTSWKKMSHLPSQVSALEKHILSAYQVNDIVWMDFNYNEYFNAIKNKTNVNNF